MKTISRVVLGLAATLPVAGLGSLSLVAASAVAPSAPAGDTIVKITGDQADGFTIHHYDGSTLYPPTDSEARAECSEYDAEVARVRCRTEVRTHYRDLAATKQALVWAHRAG